MAMLRVLTWCGMLAALAESTVPSVKSGVKLTPVPALNASQYIGRWYQMYSDFSTSLFETNFCVTADYGINPNGTVSVHNRDRKNNVTGEETEICENPDASYAQVFRCN